MSSRADAHVWDDVVGVQERLVATRYTSDRPLGARPALVLIDCYRKVFGDEPRPLAEAIELAPSACGLAAWEALGPLAQLLESARVAGAPVIHTTGEARTSARRGAATLRPRVPGEDEARGYEFMPPLEPREGELVVTKGRASAFFGTTLTTSLRLLDVDTLIVAGETTSGCVRATVVDAYSHGLKVAVIEEATFDRSPLSHKINLFDMHLKYATVLHLPEALAYLHPNRGDE